MLVAIELRLAFCLIDLEGQKLVEIEIWALNNDGLTFDVEFNIFELGVREPDLYQQSISVSRRCITIG